MITFANTTGGEPKTWRATPRCLPMPKVTQSISSKTSSQTSATCDPAHLTPEQQHVLSLRFGQDLSHREVAELMGKSEGAVKLLQFRALHALRDLLGPLQV